MLTILTRILYSTLLKYINFVEKKKKEEKRIDIVCILYYVQRD